MLQRRLHRSEIFRKSDRRLSVIPFGQSREEVRVSATEMAFERIIAPGQAKNLNRSRAAGAVSVAVEPPVEEHISRLDFHAPSKARFYEGTGQDDARVPLQMTVAGGRAASRKCLDPNRN
jgi:hypothetical protein